MKYVLILLLLSPLAATADCATNWMDCTADTPLQVSSFTLRATEVIGSITASRLTAVQRLQRHEITGAQAQGVQNQADRARVWWNLARTICHADMAGNCHDATASATAFDLLAKAKMEVK